ncbi:hypothetical protein HJC23_003602 [Cyclotella cryptica]|uniref:Uncharacterized protein n=1 Tax=Cyclotella cryptica TaxID=29204 RepID=A0ABD3QLE7_9STRA
MARARRGGGGRILVHQRTVDDQTQTIGGDIVIKDEHTEGIIETEHQSMEDKTRREYRNRIMRIIDWLRVNYPSYFEEGTRLLSEEEKQDKVFFAHQTHRDLCYSGINVKVIKAFLSEKKKKKVDPITQKVTLASVSDVKKYDDAIKWKEEDAEDPPKLKGVFKGKRTRSRSLSLYSSTGNKKSSNPSATAAPTPQPTLPVHQEIANTAASK